MCQQESSAQWWMASFDKKLEHLRQQAEAMTARFHALELSLNDQSKDFSQALQQHVIALKELEQSVQYLSHKSQMQLKENEHKVEHFMQQTENKVQDIHHATREELSALARRVEILEKLLF